MGMDPKQAARQFGFKGRLAAVEPIGSGNVNDTYIVVCRTSSSEERGILQRINRRVFKDPERVMGNIRVVTEHVHQRLRREAGSADRAWRFPRLISTREEKDFYIDGEGEWWRAMTLIASAATFDRVQNPEHAFEAGTVLGQFHRLVSDLDPARLNDSLPGFHITPLYLKAYDRVLPRPDAAKRLETSSEVKRLNRFIEERRSLAGVLESALERGELRLRLIHGDPKVNNILIDEKTSKGISIIDLDTVKPGLIHYDFGDALRSICNPAGEEVQDLAEVRFDVDLCGVFVKGYMGRAMDFFSQADHKYLYDSIRLITFELGLRFFQDYLAGDVYFKIQYPEHNLHRARVQFRLCESVEASETEIKKALQF
ncbi:MAG: aminoglycoside phosphotransferase family protein [Elusimicrobia bacterium]|nr:aminoglycoside phosphotransferase family protein [Elusimicrobiota bacterium]